MTEAGLSFIIMISIRIIIPDYCTVLRFELEHFFRSVSLGIKPSKIFVLHF